MFDYLLHFPASNTAAFVTFVTALVLLVVMALPKTIVRGQRPNILVGSICVGMVFTFIMLSEAVRWVAVLAALPPLLIAHHAIFVWLHKPRETEDSDVDTFQPGGAEVRAKTTIESYYNVQTLFIRYGFPAVLLLVEGLVLGYLLVSPDNSFASLPGKELFVRGARFGAIGAYTYVLLELGRRSFRHDLTGGVAIWSVATTAIGPLLAGTVALLWQLKLTGDSGWQAGVVLFFAVGFAPRRIIGAVEQAAMQLLRIGPAATVETRTIPLTKLRGITPAIEERLSEEGVYDVHTLASAEPVRLVRNTSFDLRQILWWMDEALLMANLPRTWQAMEDAGITGVIDLANYALPGSHPTDAELTKLGELAGMTPDLMRSMIARLYGDAQVRYVWTLYNRFTEDGAPPSA